jgi:site-specific recombinase XerD
MVAMGHLEPAQNPMAHFPKLKPPARKLPRALTPDEMETLLAAPPDDTVIGLRDRAMLWLLYGTGIRASECAGLRLEDVDLAEKTVRVEGKGGHERVVPLNTPVVAALAAYRLVRGDAPKSDSFFLTRGKKAMTRGVVYERVRRHGRRARIEKRVTPHKLRHSFATHLVQKGVGIVTIRDLLGHRLITSTQIYLHVTAQDMRAAADRHPIKDLAPTVAALLPDVKLPFQRAVARKGGG